MKLKYVQQILAVNGMPQQTTCLIPNLNSFCNIIQQSLYIGLSSFIQSFRVRSQILAVAEGRKLTKDLHLKGYLRDSGDSGSFSEKIKNLQAKSEE